MRIDGQWAGCGPKPPPDRSGIEVGPRFTAPRWLYPDSPRTYLRIALVFAFLGSLLISPWAFCTLLAVILTINVMKRSPGPTRRSERARLLTECDAQHAAWKRGDDMIAFFGRFQLNGQTWSTTSEADIARGPWPIAPIEHRWNDGTPMPKWLLVGPAYENAAAVGPGA